MEKERFLVGLIVGLQTMTDGALRGAHEVDGEVLPGTKTGQHLGMGRQSARGGARSLNIRTCIRRTRDGEDLVWARPVSCLRLPRNQGKAVPPAARAALSEYVHRSECGDTQKGPVMKLKWRPGRLAAAALSLAWCALIAKESRALSR